MTRTTYKLNHEWEFVRRKASRTWLRGAPGQANVDLPHTWNEQDSFQDGVHYYQGWGSYRRTFQVDQVADGSAETVWRLRSHGFYGTGEVWWNGHRVATFDGQYIGLDLDVTSWLDPARENQVAIRLTNRCHSSVLPGIKVPDFLLYGGLSGGLWLEQLPATHIKTNSTQIKYRFMTEDAVEVQLRCRLSKQVPQTCQVAWQIIDADGQRVAESAPQPGKDNEFVAALRLDGVRRWDVDDPYRYTVITTLWQNDQTLDEISRSIGFRTAEFRPDEGFFLNGRRLPLRGVNRHERMPGFGSAVPPWLHREDAELIKAIGLNFVRCSHYPQHPAFLDACDALGILVYAEIASWKSVRGGAWLRRAERQMRTMVLRDRHHPSVILWGMGNEGQHRRAYQRLYTLCKVLDPERAVTYAENHLYRARRCRVVGLPDVWGLNYEFEALPAGCDAARQRCVVVTESSDCPWAQRGLGDAEQHQWSVIQRDLEAMGAPPYLAGFALWSYNDYATLRRGNFRRHSGVVDAWRIPKWAAYQLAEKYGGSLATRSPQWIPVTADAEGRIELQPEQEYLDATARTTLGIRVRLVDAAGRLLDWQGVLTAQVAGPARLRAYAADGRLDVAHGQGRLFVTATGPTGLVRVTVTGGHWKTGSVQIHAGRGMGI